MKKLVFAFLLLVGGGGAAYYYFVIDKPVEKPTVNRAPITRGDILEIVQSTGTLEPTRIVQVGSQVSGIVKELHVDFNYIVKAQQVIAEIDPKLLQVQVDIQKANIEQRKGDIANQRVQLEQDVKNLERTRQQVERGLMNQQQLEQAELTKRNREAQISSAEKGLLTLEANLSQAQMNVDYTIIRSPVDGVVVNRLVDKGQTVQASLNTPQFFTIATDLRELKLSAGVDEAEIGKVEAGQRVLFKVDAYADQEFEGVVDTVRLNATNQNNVVTYPVWIKVLNPQLKLKPSMTASLRIIISTASNVLRVPNGALRWKPNNEIYTALGLTPPAAGRPLNPVVDGTNGAGKGAMGTDGKGADGKSGPQMASNAQGGTQRGDRTAGRGNQGGGNQGGGRGNSGRTPSTGFGAGAASGTPEQRQAAMQALQARYGGPGGRSGRGGGGGGRGNQPGANLTEPKKELDAQKIDELFEPIPRREMPGKVFTWDEAKKELKEYNLRYGVSDGQFSEIVRGEGLDEKTMVVTGVVLPQTAANRAGQSNLFGQPNQRGMGGMTPGSPSGGGGNPGGGGGGRGGGGGGGRGGGN